MTTAAPPIANSTLPVIRGKPPVLTEELPADEDAAPVLLPVGVPVEADPLVEVLPTVPVAVTVPLSVPAAVEVLVAVAVAVGAVADAAVLAGAVLRSPAVTVTTIIADAKSSFAYVSVLIPGKLASEPFAVWLQMAVDVPVKTQFSAKEKLWPS
jgi:hypothetical protein